jgi:methyl-galactoside transport system permease protein
MQPTNAARRMQLPSTKTMRGFIMQNGIYMVLLVLIAGIAITDYTFLSLDTLKNVLVHNSTRAIIALGVGGILITRGTDLSAGRLVGVAAVVSASMLQTAEYSRRFFPDQPMILTYLFVPILLAIVVCTLLGAINGLIVAKLNVPPFITTLGMMVIAYGINSIYFATKPNSSQPLGSLRPDFKFLGTGSLNLFGVSLP